MKKEFLKKACDLNNNIHDLSSIIDILETRKSPEPNLRYSIGVPEIISLTGKIPDIIKEKVISFLISEIEELRDNYQREFDSL